MDVPLVLTGYAGLRAAVGSELGVSGWLTVDQQRIDAFAGCTGDHAWIHVDPQRAADGPFGTSVAHGLLTLSLVTALASQTFRVDGLRFALHYGYDRVRFLDPVRVGARIRARVSLTGVEGDERVARGHYRVAVEADDASRPSCVADLIYYYTFA